MDIRIYRMTKENIGLAKALGHSISAIAQAIGRPKSTVWRELSWNSLPSGRYSPDLSSETKCHTPADLISAG
jgi:IS30 family transposase